MWPREYDYSHMDWNDIGPNGPQDAPEINAVPEDVGRRPFVPTPLLPSVIDRDAMVRVGLESRANRLGRPDGAPSTDPRSTNYQPYFLTPAVVSLPDYFSRNPNYLPPPYHRSPDAASMYLPLPNFAFDLRVASRRGPSTPPPIEPPAEPQSPQPSPHAHDPDSPDRVVQEHEPGPSYRHSCVGVPGPSHVGVSPRTNAPGPSREFHQTDNVPRPSNVGVSPRTNAPGPSREFHQTNNVPGPSREFHQTNRVSGPSNVGVSSRTNAPGPSREFHQTDNVPGPSREFHQTNRVSGPSNVGVSSRTNAPGPSREFHQIDNVPGPLREFLRSNGVPGHAAHDKPVKHARAPQPHETRSTDAPPHKTRRRRSPETRVATDPPPRVRRHVASPIDLAAIERSSTQPLEHNAASSSGRHRDEPTASTADDRDRLQPRPTKFQHSQYSAFRKFEANRGGPDSSGQENQDSR